MYCITLSRKYCPYYVKSYFTKMDKPSWTCSIDLIVASWQADLVWLSAHSHDLNTNWYGKLYIRYFQPRYWLWLSCCGSNIQNLATKLSTKVLVASPLKKENFLRLPLIFINLKKVDSSIMDVNNLFALLSYPFYYFSYLEPLGFRFSQTWN